MDIRVIYGPVGATWVPASLFVVFDLPVRERLRAGANVGDVRIDAGRHPGGFGPGRFFRASRRLVLLLCYASLLSLSFRNRRPRPLCHPRLLVPRIITTLSRA